MQRFPSRNQVGFAGQAVCPHGVPKKDEFLPLKISKLVLLLLCNFHIQYVRYRE